MPITYTSRTRKTYYLHTGPKRGGGIQYFLSTKPAGSLAETLPEGFEIYETVDGQVYLRRHRRKLIRDEECHCIERELQQARAGCRYKVEVRDRTVTIHQSAARSGDWLAELARLVRCWPAVREVAV